MERSGSRHLHVRRRRKTDRKGAHGSDDLRRTPGQDRVDPQVVRRLSLAALLVVGAHHGGGTLQALAEGPAAVHVQVRDAAAGTPLPCRLTLIGAGGKPAAITPEAGNPAQTARPGVIYTGNGSASFSVAPGRYRLFATRGLEYSLAARELDLRPGVRELSLTLSREVNTSGFVAADTHIHTLTYSGHGDCTLLERMATIAGEGIELAVATDHNHHTDYAPTSHKVGTASFFTPVVGNEVTTPVGHFNAFPIRRGARTAPIDRADWRELVAGIRATPGVRAVVLNHPSNNHSNFIPTDPRRFHPASGESLDGRTFPLDLRLDGMEVVTSAAMQSDWMKPFRDWFALLNRGSRVTGIGSSDTHDVDRYILGQGRTYLALDDRHPEALSIEDACRSLTDGRASISMGLLCEAWINGKGMGETVSGKPAKPSIRVRVQSPSWIRADRVEVFANGEWVAGRALARRRRGPGRWDVTLPLPASMQDQWIVAIATGPGVREPYWPSPRPYQPTRPDWEPRVIGATNPIHIDRDGDGLWRSPRDEALRLVEGVAGDTQRLFAKLGERDSATAVQAAAILRGRGRPTTGPLVERSAPHVRQAFAAYTALLSR